MKHRQTRLDEYSCAIDVLPSFIRRNENGVNPADHVPGAFNDIGNEASFTELLSILAAIAPGMRYADSRDSKVGSILHAKIVEDHWVGGF